jgi:formate/nitrite transporter
MEGFLSPKEVAETVEVLSQRKSRLGLGPLTILGILAGVYIGFGAELSTIVTHDMGKYFGLGFSKFMGGSVFTVGLMLVVIAGAELFTGNCLMTIGLLSRNLGSGAILRNWLVVFPANFAGSMLLVVIMYYGGTWKMGQSGVGLAALNTAIAKVNLSWTEAFCRGIGCNWLVCLAVWMALAGRDAVSKIFGIYFPIMAFVASGFEHSIANMFFIPMGLFLKGNAALLAAPALLPGIEHLTWSSFLVGNLVPVTLGNIVGGGFFVGTFYYYAYLRGRTTTHEQRELPGT